MYVGFNELSLHGQIAGADADVALRFILDIRQRVAAHGTTLRTHRAVLERPFTPTISLGEYLKRLPTNNSLKLLILRWLTKDGPFLDSDREHDSGIYFECCGQLVTDTVLAEVAHRQSMGVEATCAVSVSPSDHVGTTIEVIRCDSDERRAAIKVTNYCAKNGLDAWLVRHERPMCRWEDLLSRAEARCRNLEFGSDVIKPLGDQPFDPSIAEALLERLMVLEQMKRCFDPSGTLTSEGQALRQMHFVGEKAWFTDSSLIEKNNFRSEMTFADAKAPDGRVFCPWHGKVKMRQMRIHFSYPITAAEPVFVGYIGPKITKR